MSGTVKQDGVRMAETIVKVAGNYLGGMDAVMGIGSDMLEGKWRINIPYSLYTGEEKK